MDKVACDLFKENVKNNWFDLTVTWNVKFDVFFYFEVDLTFKNLTFDVANHSDVDAWRMRKTSRYNIDVPITVAKHAQQIK